MCPVIRQFQHFILFYVSSVWRRVCVKRCFNFSTHLLLFLIRKPSFLLSKELPAQGQLNDPWIHQKGCFFQLIEKLKYSNGYTCRTGAMIVQKPWGGDAYNFHRKTKVGIAKVKPLVLLQVLYWQEFSEQYTTIVRGIYPRIFYPIDIHQKS